MLVCASGSVAGIKVPELVAALEGRGLVVKVAATQHGLTFLDKAPSTVAPPLTDVHCHGNTASHHTQVWLSEYIM